MAARLQARLLWTLFRTKRGKPFTRAWLRDVMAKPQEPAAVQIVNAGGPAATAAFLNFMGNAGGYLCVATPALGTGSLDEAFETLLTLSPPQPMALLSSKGVIQAANDAFRSGQRRRYGPEHGALRQIAGPSRGGFLPKTSPPALRSLANKALSGTVPPSCKSPSKAARAGLCAFPFFRRRAAAISSPPRPKQQNGAGSEEAVQSQKLQAVGELAGGIAHDFNNLLTAIIGYSDLLLRRFRASDFAFKDVMKIKGSATRAAELVKQILAYSRRQTLRPAILKLTDVIEEFQATIGRTLGEKVKATAQHCPRPVVRQGG